MNARLEDYLRSTYGVESRLELEFEAIYRRFFLPPVRTLGSGDARQATGEDEEPESRGQAKGYAGLRLVAAAAGDAGEKEALEVVGMEAVRHDWTPLAQELQREILTLAFHDAGPEERTGIIRYVWTTDGPQPERRRTAPPDYEHYVQKQVRPIVESVAPYIGLRTESIFTAGESHSIDSRSGML